MKAVALVGAMVLVSACSGSRVRYVVMHSTLVDPARQERPDIASTDAPIRARSVALRAPDACANQGAAENTGAAMRRGNVVQTDCGVEMAELERALTRAGYTVFSWKQIQGMSRASSPEEAARQLGAEVLFQVNSLERVAYAPGPDARWNRSFFTSDATGVQGEPFALKTADLRTLEPSFASAEHIAMQRLGAMLDLNAISTATGQTLWFYRRVRFQDPDPAWTGMLLTRRNGGWVPIAATDGARPAVTAQRQVVAPRVQPRDDRAYFELVGTVVSEFVEAFSAAQRSPQASAPSP